jgi:hypothetical protein
MLGFFSIRRLVEAGGRLSDSTALAQVRVREYPRTASYMTRFNRDRVDKHFDLDAPTDRTRSLTSIANQFIHSYVLMPVLSETRLCALLVCSDWQRHHSCMELAAREAVRLFRKAARDNPTRVDARCSMKVKDLVFTVVR